MRSKLYRFVLRPHFVGGMILLGVAGWTLAVAGTPLPSTDAEAASYWRFFLAALGAVVGIFTLFGTGMALGARWVAEPAARKVLLEHMNRGAAAHESLVPRVDWDLKHGALLTSIGTMEGELRELRRSIEEDRGRRSRRTASR